MPNSRRGISEEDRILSGHLERAVRELEQASDFARRNRSQKNQDLIREIRQHVLGIHRMASLFSHSSTEARDTDSLSEDELSQRFHDRKKQREVAKPQKPEVIK